MWCGQPATVNRESSPSSCRTLGPVLLPCCASISYFAQLYSNASHQLDWWYEFGELALADGLMTTTTTTSTTVVWLKKKNEEDGEYSWSRQTNKQKNKILTKHVSVYGAAASAAVDVTELKLRWLLRTVDEWIKILVIMWKTTQVGCPLDANDDDDDGRLAAWLYSND